MELGASPNHIHPLDTCADTHFRCLFLVLLLHAAVTCCFSSLSLLSMLFLCVSAGSSKCVAVAVVALGGGEGGVD